MKKYLVIVAALAFLGFPELGGAWPSSASAYAQKSKDKKEDKKKNPPGPPVVKDKKEREAPPKKKPKKPRSEG